LARTTPSLPDLVRDGFDADITNELPTGDATALDLAPLGADATGEIEAADILASSDDLPDDDTPYAGVPSVSFPVQAMRRLSPSSGFMNASTASSLAPIAIHVEAPGVSAPAGGEGAPRVTFPSLPSWSDTPSVATARRHVPGAGGGSRTALVVTGILALCLCAGGVGAALGYATATEPGEAAGAPIHAPREAVVLGGRPVHVVHQRAR
jgi:hypothetical protein